jgi:hypothetical protein
VHGFLSRYRGDIEPIAKRAPDLLIPAVAKKCYVSTTSTKGLAL